MGQCNFLNAISGSFCNSEQKILSCISHKMGMCWREVGKISNVLEKKKTNRFAFIWVKAKTDLGREYGNIEL